MSIFSATLGMNRIIEIIGLELELTFFQFDHSQYPNILDDLAVKLWSTDIQKVKVTNFFFARMLTLISNFSLV